MSRLTANAEKKTKIKKVLKKKSARLRCYFSLLSARFFRMRNITPMTAMIASQRTVILFMHTTSFPPDFGRLAPHKNNLGNLSG